MDAVDIGLGGTYHPVDVDQALVAALVGDIWLASLIAWVRHGASTEDVAIGLERSIALIVHDER